MKFIPIYKKTLFWVFIAIIILAPFIPYIISYFLINKDGVWMIGRWSSGDILGYIGTLLGGTITFVGVAITINNENERFKDTLRSDVLPYISFFANDYIQGNNMLPSKAFTLFVNQGCNFWNKQIDLQTYSAKKAERRIYTNGAILYTFDDKVRMFDIRLKNVGRGIAKGLNFECLGKSSMKLDLDANEEMRLIISLDKSMPKDIFVKLTYQNLYDDIFNVGIHIFLENNQYEIEINR